MLNLPRLIRYLANPPSYIWVTVHIIKETPKAVLILFDNRQAWIPKVWILQIKPSKRASAKIRIAEYLWAKKFL